MKIALASLLLVACSPQHWKAADVTLEATVAVSLVLDHSQTVDITHDCLESNMVIGKCGTRVHPHIYFPAVMLAHVAATRAMPMPARIGTQLITLIAQAWAIDRNSRHGYAP